MGKKKQNSKKRVLVVVEGNSDRRALEYGLSVMIEEKSENLDVDFYLMHNKGEIGGDITSQYGVRADNVQKMIVKLCVVPYLHQYKLYAEDISEIIQIVDTDGAYIPDDMVFEKEDADNDYYEHGIYTKKKENITQRNRTKRENMDVLAASSSLRVSNTDIPYTLYYISCNLDHYIHDDANLLSYEKVPMAEEFSRNCIQIPMFFHDTFKNFWDECVKYGYQDSWEYIRKENNSLKKHSNISRLIDRITE